MGPLKVYFLREIRIWIHKNQQALRPFDIMELFGRSYREVQTYTLADNALLTTGIYPWNVFSETNFIAAEQEATKRGITVSIQEVKTTPSTNPLAPNL